MRSALGNSLRRSLVASLVVLVAGGCASSGAARHDNECSKEVARIAAAQGVKAAMRFTGERLREHIGESLPALRLTPIRGATHPLSEYYRQVTVVALIPSFDAGVLDWVDRVRALVVSATVPSRLLLVSYDVQPGKVRDYLRKTDDAFVVERPLPKYLGCIITFPIALVASSDGVFLGYGWTAEEIEQFVPNNGGTRR